MNNNATAPAPTAATDKLAAALAATEEPLTQTGLAEAAGVARSTASTWLGQQVAQGLVVRYMHDKAPATFARPGTPADAEGLLTEAARTTEEEDIEALPGHVLAAMGTPGFTAALEEAAAADAAAHPQEWEDTTEAEIEADRQAAVAADPEIPAPPAEEEAPVAPTLTVVRDAPAACHCGDDAVGHVHTKKESAARSTRAGRVDKDTAWAHAEKVLRLAGANGLPVPELWTALQDAGLAQSGAYALVNRKRDAGVLVTAVDAPRLANRRYALAI